MADPEIDGAGTQNKYSGFQRTTVNGEKCANWDAPGIYDKSPPGSDSWTGLSENFCRNPNSDKNIWCYVDKKIT